MLLDEGAELFLAFPSHGIKRGIKVLRDDDERLRVEIAQESFRDKPERRGRFEFIRLSKGIRSKLGGVTFLEGGVNLDEGVSKGRWSRSTGPRPPAELPPAPRGVL